MSINSSFSTVAEQIINYNNNIVELLSQFTQLTTTPQGSLPIRVFDSTGVLTTYNIPSFTFLKTEIDRLNSNINAIYGLDGGSAFIQPANNLFKKIITVDLNIEPNSINALPLTTTFTSDVNIFFDQFTNPLLSVEIDLTDAIDNTIQKIQSKRFIVSFPQTISGLTTQGQTALNSFNSLWRGQNNINYDDFVYWLSTTPGVVGGANCPYDLQIYDLQPNGIMYSGIFSVLLLEEDAINKVLWYHLNTNEYIDNSNNQVKQLSVGDILFLNSTDSHTRFQITNTSFAASNFRVAVQRLEGNQPIPVGVGVLKIYSTVLFNKQVKVNINYNERAVIFFKSLNTDNNILSSDWSQGTGFFTNDLTLDSVTPDNGTPMAQYYSNNVFDYGLSIKDLVSKKIPNILGSNPNPPVLDLNNFMVVQTNKHLTDSDAQNANKDKFKQQLNLKSDLTQLDTAINNKSKQLKVTNFLNTTEKSIFDNQLSKLVALKSTKSSQLSSTVSDIITNNNINAPAQVNPKYSVRGFWTMPDPIIAIGTRPQEVIQFRIEYRYLSTIGKENPIQTFQLPIPLSQSVQTSPSQPLSTQLTTTAAFSNWTPVISIVRDRVMDPTTGEYTWAVVDTSSADTPNINQLDIPLNPGEQVEIRIKSISEVGWPEAPLTSDFSNTITVVFPDNINTVVDSNSYILKEANKEDLKISITNDFNAMGLEAHLADAVTVNNTTYFHHSATVLSGFTDGNGVAIDLYTYLQSLVTRIQSLEEQIAQATGVLKITVFKNNTEYVVQNGTELTFNVECEDYLEKYTSTAVTGRVYVNQIYTIKDFLIKIENVSASSVLGLISNKPYLQNSQFFNLNAPQVFWVNNNDELLFDTTNGDTRTHLDNQYIWSVNYDSISQNSVNRLGENIGNLFTSVNSNSITDELSKSEYNVGYSNQSILNFIGTNNSLLEMAKWVDTTTSLNSTTKLLTTIQPVTPSLEDLVDTSPDQIKIINAGSQYALSVPINIYFKLNSIDPNAGTGANYDYIDLNKAITTTRHVKKLKFLLENSGDNKPFVFTVKFNINRNKVSLIKDANILGRLTQNTLST